MAVDPALELLAKLTLAAVFATAAVAKLRAFEAFAGTVHNFRLLPEALARPTAYLLPPLEALIALGLLWPATVGASALGAHALLAIFALAIAINLQRGRRSVDCGCFGFDYHQPLSWWLVGRNALLAILALVVLLGGPASRALHWLDIASALAGAITLLALYLALERIVALDPGGASAREGLKP
jgi:hypothetical protein